MGSEGMNTNEMNELRNTIKHLEQANALHRKQLATNSKLIQQFKRRLDVLESAANNQATIQ